MDYSILIRINRFAEAFIMRPLRSPGNFLKSDSGFVLLYVLWITVAVMALAFTLSRNGKEIMNIEEVYETRLALQNELYSLRKTLITFLHKGQMAGTSQITVGHCKIFIDNANAFLPLNATNSDELYRLCTTIGIQDKRAAIIADSLMDWKDMDNIERPNGAEDNFYQALTPPYHCANTNFTSIDQLLLVRGITKAIAEKLSKYVTPYSREINFNYAPPPVIYAVCGDMAMVKSIIEFRHTETINEQNLRILLGEHLYEELMNRYTFNDSSYHRLVIIASDHSIKIYHHEWLKGK